MAPETSPMHFVSRSAALPALPTELPPPVLTATSTTAVRGLVPTAAMLQLSQTLRHDRPLDVQAMLKFAKVDPALARQFGAAKTSATGFDRAAAEEHLEGQAGKPLTMSVSAMSLAVHDKYHEVVAASLAEPDKSKRVAPADKDEYPRFDDVVAAGAVPPPRTANLVCVARPATIASDEGRDDVVGAALTDALEFASLALKRRRTA
mgnify:CR=1 FL=1